MRFLSVVLVSLSALAFFGCTTPPAARDVLASDRAARDQLTSSYAMDLSLTRTLVATCLQAKRVILTGDIERAIIADGLVLGSDFDPKALDKLASDPTSVNPIVAEVRQGHLTIDQARTLLSDYAAMGKLSNAREARRARIASLPPVVQFDSASADLLAAFDTHAAQVAKLLGELDSNSTAFSAVLDSRQLTTNDIVGSLSLAAQTFIKDPAKQTSVLNLIGSLAPVVAPTK